MNNIISLFISILVVCLLLVVAFVVMSNLTERMIPYQINCSELNGTTLIRECFCQPILQLLSGNRSLDCNCDKIAGEYCELPNGTEIKLITHLNNEYN